MADPATVHRVYLAWTERGEAIHTEHLQYTTYLDLSRWTSSFSAMAGFSNRELAVGDGDHAREIKVGAVSASFFDFFHARPALGRFFSEAEDALPAGSPVSVLSHAYWQTRYGGRLDVLGTRLQVGKTPTTIIGVAPPGFVGINDDGPPLVFIPITNYGTTISKDYYRNYGWDWMHMLVRRKPGVSTAAASVDLSSAFLRSWNTRKGMERSLPPADVARPHAVAAAVPLARGPEASRDAKVVTWISAVALVVMLIACANVANLLLARALRRRREIAMRLALGISRGRLVRQLLTESCVLAVLGGAAGLAVAQWGGGALRALLITNEDAVSVASDGRTIAFAVVATLAAAVLTGLVPALHTGRGDLATTLKAGGRDGAHHRSTARTALLVFQGSLSVVLLVGAGLFVRSMQNVRALRLGYDVEPILYVAAHGRSVKPAPAEMAALKERMLDEARSSPGVVRATRTQMVPFWSGERRLLFVPGIDSVRRLGHFDLAAGSPDYFATMGTRILRGRGFTRDDGASAPRVAVVSEAMAGIIWPGRDAIGQCMRINADTMPCTTIVGIAENIRSRSITDAPESHYYLPIAQYDQHVGSSFPWLFVRVDGRAADYAESTRQRLQRLMPGDAYVTVDPMRTIVDPTQRAWRTGATMFVAFGGLALALAAIGLYSVIAYDVAQRTRELGVRIALGAQARDVTRLIVGQGIGLAALGVVIGGTLALAAGRWVAPLLFAVSPRDPVVFGGVVAVLLGVAAVASVIPALRATRVDPTEALRSD
jgi:predicted permease